MNNLQTILVAVFLAFFGFAVLIFSGLIKVDTPKGAVGRVTIWGTFPGSFMRNSLDAMNSSNNKLTLNYSQIDSSTYQQDLVEAFANGNGPDIFVITPDMIQRNNNFIYKIPYASYSEKLFTDSFIDGASIYLDKDGITGLPLVIDPIVLYYNKDILSNEGIINPPSSWDQLFTLNSSLTKRENNGVVNQSMIALGQYSNINNAKDILATLLLQNDNQIVDKVDTGYIASLNSALTYQSVTPIEAVLKFFLEFSNPQDIAYSWNRSLPDAFDMFTSGKSALYIGRASELFNIQLTNPNLSFDVSLIPQVKDYKIRRTYGEIYALAINKRSGNLASALQVAGDLSLGDNAQNISVGASLPPASRALLSSNKPTGSGSNFLSIFFDSAVISRSWADPDKSKSDEIFKNLVENILSNNLSVGEAVTKAQGQLDILIKNVNK